MLQTPIKKHDVSNAIQSAFGRELANDSSVELIKKNLAAVGIRFASVYLATAVHTSKQFGKHLSLRAVVRDGHESFTDCVIKMDVNFNILTRTEVEKEIQAPKWRESHADPRRMMGDYRDDR